MSHFTVMTTRRRVGLRDLSQSHSWSLMEPGLDSAPGPRVCPGRQNQWAEITGTLSVHPRACCPRLDIPPTPRKVLQRKEEPEWGLDCGEEDQVGEVRKAGSVGSPGKQMLSWSQEFTEVEAHERLRGDSLRLRRGCLQAWANPTGTHVAPESPAWGRNTRPWCPACPAPGQGCPGYSMTTVPGGAPAGHRLPATLLGADRPIGLVHILLLQPSQLWASAAFPLGSLPLRLLRS